MLLDSYSALKSDPNLSSLQELTPSLYGCSIVAFSSFLLSNVLLRNTLLEPHCMRHKLQISADYRDWTMQQPGHLQTSTLYLQSRPKHAAARLR